MCALKPKSVLGQAFVIVCLIFVLLVFDLGFARTEGGPVHSDLVGKNFLASIKIDTVSHSNPPEVVEIPILIRNDVEFCEFELEVDFCYHNLTLVGAERGEALSHISNGEYEWEFFTYRILPYTDSLYRCCLYGFCDLPDGHPGVPLAPNSDYVSLVVLQFVIKYGTFTSGAFFPIIFEWEASDCLENTFQSSYFDTLYVSQDSLQFNPMDCPPESVENLPVSPSLEFSDGGVTAVYPSELRGDVNLNWVAYEVADWVLFHNFLLYGDSLLIDPEKQSVNSDVNCDYLPWSIADFLYLCRVILGEAPEIPCKHHKPVLQGSSFYGQDTTDELTLVCCSAHPGEIASVPVLLSNSMNVRGTTFKVVFDSSVLSVEGVDVSRTRIEEWEKIHAVINPGELFFLAYPDWWDILQSYLSIGPGHGVLIKIYFRVAEDTPSGTYLPITFVTEENRGHYNAYTDTTGLTLVQPSLVSGWIFTDVIPGDTNSDGIVDVADLVYLIDHLYRGKKPPRPLSLGDFLQDNEVNLGDVIALINFVLRS
ncbi:hypothetical protein AMJ44_15790 [candidate division WOR-1 bacterium DG_54_3]|uniref:Dockerin domain-containing protein n=1 Tax=candidate division WOR-1 bacterium DG_54_3 TaxID=1703775 RepID=A0A0S7XIL5_UNCSA|nr:MAG: hypothetical protein AMJ44_15790 [candidate division WOR-1 bacterium DG_54_3]